MATPSLKLTLLTIFTILLVKGFSSEEHEQQQRPCGSVDGLAVLLGCQNFLLKDGPKVPPSGDCCKAVEEIGMNCTCKIITKDIEAILSMEKLAIQFHQHEIFFGEANGGHLQITQ
ncbi:hypothetical protein Pint_30932 [Pistacia integerrima]|uniref:Uncharacterized protein n=2 Tax=Pistacia TaxID=55512 RepID=A0ACC1AEZ8_9ROSI|nr:hypothetical protein Pint_30932 [Pistacia integerrima]KAJ0084923.1 hypothetical protein Patl1_29459 [Pistacia atlantica]